VQKPGIILIALLIIVMMFSCEIGENGSPQETDLLIGSWVSSLTTDSIVRYKRSSGLIDQEYGFTLHSDYTFTERKNSGWCATPPVQYADFEGDWSRDGSMIDITVGYWGGMASYSWELVSVDSVYLRVKWIESRHLRDVYLDSIPADNYYASEIFDSPWTDIYGTWYLYGISGGIHGGGHELNFDYLEIKHFGIYGYIRNDSVLEYGRVSIQEQTTEALLVTLLPDENSEQFLWDNEKYVHFGGPDSLNLASPCCDRYNYHYSRKY
jgi:hypothetical protein